MPKGADRNKAYYDCPPYKPVFFLWYLQRGGSLPLIYLFVELNATLSLSDLVQPDFSFFICPSCIYFFNSHKAFAYWTISQKVDNKMEIGKMDKGEKNGPTEIR